LKRSDTWRRFAVELVLIAVVPIRLLDQGGPGQLDSPGAPSYIRAHARGT
jgi:hypothetical protein